MDPATNAEPFILNPTDAIGGLLLILSSRTGPILTSRLYSYGDVRQDSESLDVADLLTDLEAEGCLVYSRAIPKHGLLWWSPFALRYSIFEDAPSQATLRPPVLDAPVFLSPTIPPELFHPILSYVTARNTLFALCYTSQALRHYAERRLYSSISASDGSNAPLHIGFLRTITQNPRLAKFVKEYYSLSIVVYRENPLWDLTRLGLQAMTGLKVLVFRGFGGHPSGELLYITDQGEPSFQLKKLHWGNHSDERFMEKILVDQGQSLRELAFECRPRPTPFPPHACPNLDYLCGNRAAVEALLPGRGITRLSWVPELDDSKEDPVVGLDKELAGLRTLSFGGYFCRPHLELIAPFLGGLEVLELVGLGIGELSLLKDLPSLRELVFSLRWGMIQFPVPSKGREHQVKKLFSDCRKLMRVDIVHEWRHVEPDTIRYQRWERKGGEPTFLTRLEVREGRF